jgi:hypothetical protein
MLIKLHNNVSFIHFQIVQNTMEINIKLIYLISLVSLGSVHASIKQVSVRDKKNQFLMTSSLLTWESFNQNDPQFEFAVTGGTFTGVDVNQFDFLL